jgi:hypothetical protein
MGVKKKKVEKTGENYITRGITVCTHNQAREGEMGGHVECMVEKRNTHRGKAGKPERRHVEDPDVDGRVMLK